MKRKQKLTPEQKQQIRIAIYKRQDGKCCDCGEQLTLAGMHCHERIFRSKGGQMSLENSIGLCASCHEFGPNARHANRRPRFSKKELDSEKETC